MTTPATLAHLDQLHAACREALDVLEHTAHVYGTTITADPLGPWLTTHVQTLATALHTGTARYCPHVASGPQLLHAALWAPAVLVCTRCAPTHLRPEPIEDTTCDHCRTPMDAVNVGVLALGPILLEFGLCDPCLNTTSIPSH